MPLKNLLYIGNKLSATSTGTTTVIDSLSLLLRKEGFVVTAKSDKQNQFLRLADMVVAVLKNGRKTDFVLIDTYSTSGFWFAFIVSQLCRLLRLSYIPILHGGKLPERLKKNPRLCGMVFTNAFKNVAPSHYLLTAFQKAGYSNLVFIPNSIEIHQYPFKERKTVVPKLLWVRSFSKIYHPTMAVAVLHELQKSYPMASLCMVGPEKDGALAATRQYAEALGVTVTFTGKLTRHEWTALSEQYAIFINTTHFDNTPVSVMEALALGMPVVSTNVGGIPFLLQDQKEALLVADGDVAGMVLAIQHLIENSELAHSLSVYGRKKAETFDWSAVKTKWKMLFKV